MSQKKQKPSSSSHPPEPQSQKMTAKRRHASATVHVDGKEKFPVDNAHSARSAVHLLNTAKPPLTSGQRVHVMREVHHYLPNVTPPSPTKKRS